jgi:hypothetical protein
LAPLRGIGSTLQVLAALLSGCASTPPSQVEDACQIFAEKPAWYRASKATEVHWELPIPIQLAIVRQESSFQDDAKPPRERFLGVALWWRTSSAFGYAQAKDSTWDWYREKTGRRAASRKDYADAVDFIGWYTDVSQRVLGISKWDAYHQYLAYHEGHGGFKRKSYQRKAWLLEVARKVERYAVLYADQLRRCRPRLDDRPRHWPFVARLDDP